MEYKVRNGPEVLLCDLCYCYVKRLLCRNSENVGQFHHWHLSEDFET